MKINQSVDIQKGYMQKINKKRLEEVLERKS